MQNLRQLVASVIFTATLGLSVVWAQGNPGSEPGETTTPAHAAARPWRFGSEFDVLPFALGGYYGSLFAGHDDWRIRAVVATSNVPSFLVSDGFEKKRTNAYALLLDRFVGPGRHEMKGFWIGGGGEFWRNRIRQDNTPPYTYYNNFDLTVGGGYVWMIGRHFYLNPWGDVHAVVGGKTKIDVTGKTYNQPRFMAQPSIKLGIVF